MIVIRKHPGISNTEMIMNRQNEIYVKKKLYHAGCIFHCCWPQ